VFYPTFLEIFNYKVLILRNPTDRQAENSTYDINLKSYRTLKAGRQQRGSWTVWKQTSDWLEYHSYVFTSC